jgi:cytochrome P450
VCDALRTTRLPSDGVHTGSAPVPIRKRTGVGYFVYHMHRLRSLYEDDASEFRPERWREGGWKKR